MVQKMKADMKPRIYFDTTIPNYLFADDAPSRMKWTWRLWEKCVAGEYGIHLSDIFFKELEPCPEPKLGKMIEQLGLLEFVRLAEKDEVRELATEYVKAGVLTQKRFNDCLHIAYSVVYDCDVILSWNFDDIVNDRTRGRVKTANAVGRYKGIEIVSPDEFLKGDRG